MILSFFISFNLKAEPSRKPAIIKTVCDFNTPEYQIKLGSEKIFVSEVSHEVVVLNDNGTNCSEVKDNRFSDLVYKKYARQEMKILFDQNPKDYTKSCEAYFVSEKIKKTDHVCKVPQKISITIKHTTCENKVAKAIALVSYEYESVLLEEKSACTMVNECIKLASENELPELSKLATVACKNKLIIPESGKAPVLIRDSQSFDGKRILDSKEINNEPSMEELELKNTGK